MGKAILETLSDTREKSIVPEELVAQARIAEKVSIGIDHLKEIGKKSLYTCPDCGGGLWVIDENGTNSYRCHVGHAYTEDRLLGAMESTTEAALWTALRIIEERRNLLAGIAAKEKVRARKQTLTHYTKRIDELEKQIEQIKKVLFSTEQD